MAAVAVTAINRGTRLRQLFDLGDVASRRSSVQPPIGLPFSRARIYAEAGSANARNNNRLQITCVRSGIKTLNRFAD